MQELYKIITDLLTILYSGENFWVKFCLLATYVKILIKFYLLVSLMRIPIQHESIFSYKVVFPDYTVFFSLFREIFIYKRYFFKSTTKVPFIIDCGAHIGLSVIYFKYLYPESKIIAFEPNKFSFSYLTKNLKINNISNVETINAAVGNKDETGSFYTEMGNKTSMISSKFKISLEAWNKESIEFFVDVVDLSRYIVSSVELIKLDIEGSEGEIIEAIKHKMMYVNQLIIEYHYFWQDDSSNSLSSLLEILESSGFKFIITSSIREDLVRFHINFPYTLHIYAYKTDI